MTDLELQTRIFDQLYALGLTANYTGFFHVSRAVLLAYRAPERLTCVTKWLYSEVADHYGTTLTAVERNIRYSIGILWREHPNRLCDLTGSLLTAPPKAVKFLSLLVSKLPPSE